MNANFDDVNAQSRTLFAGQQLPDKYRVLEDWTTVTAAYKTYIVFNEIFKRNMIVKCVRENQYLKYKDFLIMVSLWMKISDHPNIPTIHYIEYLNDTPLITMEYVANASIERNQDNYIELVTSNSFFKEGNSATNLSMLLKIILIVCDVLEYAHTNSVLHLALSPSRVLWSVQDLIETQVYQIANPLNRNGIMVTEFGNLLIFDMQSQNYNSASNKTEIDFIDGYW